jgi:hypothetical protein
VHLQQGPFPQPNAFSHEATSCIKQLGNTRHKSIKPKKIFLDFQIFSESTMCWALGFVKYFNQPIAGNWLVNHHHLDRHSKMQTQDVVRRRPCANADEGMQTDLLSDDAFSRSLLMSCSIGVGLGFFGCLGYIHSTLRSYECAVVLLGALFAAKCIRERACRPSW